MNTAWTFLILAGLLEIGWPLGLQLAQAPGKALWAIPLAVLCMAASGLFLFLALAQKDAMSGAAFIPMGTAYAVWSGIGAAGTFAVGVAFFGDSIGTMRVLGVALIIGGVAMLKLSH